MSNHYLRLLLVFSLALAAAGAQSPYSGPVDPGPLVPDAQTGFSIPAGYSVTLLADLSTATTAVECIELMPNGDIVFSSTAGSACGLPATADIWRIPMTNGAPTAPLQLIQVTTNPIYGHVLKADGAGNIFAAGTCDQTSHVYYLPAGSGLAQNLNPLAPLNDPDGIALGALPGFSSSVLFVAAQDQLYAMDVSNLPSVTTTPVAVDLTAVGVPALGNWAGLCWDPNTQSLVGYRVGSPAFFETVELATSAYPGMVPATSLGNVGLEPLAIDDRGIRIFGSNLGEVGMLDVSTASPVFVPLVTGLNGRPDAAIAPSGSLYILERTTASLYRLDPTLTADVINLTASTGGFINLTLQAPPGRGVEPYLIVMGASGASPGTSLSPTLFVPINPDLLTVLGLEYVAAGSPIFTNWIGFLDGSGSASASLFVPPIRPSRHPSRSTSPISSRTRPRSARAPRGSTCNPDSRLRAAWGDVPDRRASGPAVSLY